MTRPVIAISSGRVLNDTPLGRVDTVYLTSAYADAVVEAGGRPIVLPVTARSIERPLEGVAGLIFSGGGDIDPSLYDAWPAHELYGVDRERDLLELELARDAQQLAIPVLAICRGMQLVNVASGGTVNQHLSEADLHRQSTAPDQTQHDVSIVQGSWLEQIMGPGSDSLPVNSSHHQGLDLVGDGLRVSAWHDDVIEGLESPDGRTVGVQWHPEHMVKSCGRQLHLFQDLVQRANKKAYDKTS